MRSSLCIVLALSAACSGDDAQITLPDARADAAPGQADAAVADAFEISGDALAACTGAASALEAELYDSFGGCTAIVRLDYQSRAIIGYQIVCGVYMTALEPLARTQAMTDTGFGQTGGLVSEDDPYDHFVFLESDGVGVVSAITQLSVFGGEITAASPGDTTYPTVWRPAADLAAGCPPAGGVALERGWDLRDASALAADSVDAAVSVVAGTALLDAFWSGTGRAFDALVLLYPRQVGAFDPATAEWVVLINGGTLM